MSQSFEAAAIARLADNWLRRQSERHPIWPRGNGQCISFALWALEQASGIRLGGADAVGYHDIYANGGGHLVASLRLSAGRDDRQFTGLAAAQRGDIVQVSPFSAGNRNPGTWNDPPPHYPGTPHTAIIDLADDPGAWSQWDVIDANWHGDKSVWVHPLNDVLQWEKPKNKMLEVWRFGRPAKHDGRQ